jgi:hypothetical protein
MNTLTDELRRRLDVPAALVPDELLEHQLEVAGNSIAPWLGVHVDPHPFQANIDEATLQLAVKLWDLSGNGVSGQDAAGEWMMPAPTASPGLVRSVFGALGPALATGGLSV